MEARATEARQASIYASSLCAGMQTPIMNHLGHVFAIHPVEIVHRHAKPLMSCRETLQSADERFPFRDNGHRNQGCNDTSPTLRRPPVNENSAVKTNRVRRPQSNRQARTR